MLKLTHAEQGKFGSIRNYEHAKYGRVQVLTLWREPGAHIIHVMAQRSPWLCGVVLPSAPQRRRKKAKPKRAAK
jgi:hypothetical protein